MDCQSLISPPMKATVLPSAETRGSSICIFGAAIVRTAPFSETKSRRATHQLLSPLPFAAVATNPPGAQSYSARDPPIVVAVALRCRRDEPARRPVVFVDISVGGGDKLQRATLRGQHRDALLVVLLADLAHQRSAGFDRPRHLARAFRDEQRDARTVGRVAHIVGDAGDLGHRARLGALHDIERGLAR